MVNKIKFSYKEADNQTGTFTPYHTRFKCKIKVDGLSYAFPYQCNPDHDEPNLVMCLDALFCDMFAYEDSKDLLDFVREYGYETETGARAAYKACKKTYKALHRLFTEEELDALYNEVEKAQNGD